MRRIGAPVAVTVSRHRPVAFQRRGQRYRISVLGTWHLMDRWWDAQRHANRTYWRMVTPDHQVFELYQEASTGAWVLDVVQD
jgi:hypothetical protein